VNSRKLWVMIVIFALHLSAVGEEASARLCLKHDGGEGGVGLEHAGKRRDGKASKRE